MLFEPEIKNGFKNYILFGFRFRARGDMIDSNYIPHPVISFFFWTTELIDSFISIPFLKLKKNLEYLFGIYFIRLKNSNAIHIEYMKYKNNERISYKGTSFGLDNNLKNIAIKPIIKNESGRFYIGWIIFNFQVKYK